MLESEFNLEIKDPIIQLCSLSTNNLNRIISSFDILIASNKCYNYLPPTLRRQIHQLIFIQDVQLAYDLPLHPIMGKLGLQDVPLASQEDPFIRLAGAPMKKLFQKGEIQGK